MASAAYIVMRDIENLWQLPLKLFTAKMIPTLACRLEQIWYHLTENNITILENAKATYLKRTICQPRFTAQNSAKMETFPPF
jgi:hypothetical protein